MATITSTQQLVLDGAQRRAAEAFQAALAAAEAHGWQSPEATEAIGVATELDATASRLRGSVVGTGYWAADGGTIDGRWHEGREYNGGASAVHWVRYELGVEQAHGYADPVSRRITQTG